MLLGYLVMKKRYSLAQIVRINSTFRRELTHTNALHTEQAAVVFVSAGVILATLSRPSAPKTSEGHVDVGRYTVGVAMLTFSLVLTGILGVLQERTYTKYGPHWKEGVFYTVRTALAFIHLFCVWGC